MFRQMVEDPQNNHDLAIIGSGFAGLAVAQQACQQGLNFCLVGKNFGGTQHFSGAFDLVDLDWAAPKKSKSVSRSLVEGLCDYVTAHPNHLYAQLCTDAASAAELLGGLRAFLDFFDLPCRGDGERSVSVLTAQGHCRQAAFALRTHAFADTLPEKVDGAVLITLKGIPDYPAELIRENLLYTFKTVRVVEYAGLSPNFSAPLSSIISCLDDVGAMDDFTKFLSAKIKPHELVVLPPILGLENFLTNHEVLQGKTSCPVVEMLSVFPSVSGLRLTRILENEMLQRQWTRFLGTVRGYETHHQNITAVMVRSERGEQKIWARDFVLATGKYVGGGIVHHGHFAENLFDLPLVLANDPISSHTHITQVISRKVTDIQDFMKVGVRWKDSTFANLKVCGHALAGFDFARDSCGFGISVASAMRCLG